MRVLVGALALLAAAPGWAGPLAPAHDLCAEDARCRMASDAELERLRGGVDVDTRLGRLRLDIGITRSVSINEQLVAVSRLILPNLQRGARVEPLVVQNGPGSFAPPPAAFHAGAVPTIVQNTLDNQQIRTVTLISASINSLSALSALRMGEIMSRATAASGR